MDNTDVLGINYFLCSDYDSKNSLLDINAKPNSINKCSKELFMNNAIAWRDTDVTNENSVWYTSDTGHGIFLQFCEMWSRMVVSRTNGQPQASPRLFFTKRKSLCNVLHNCGSIGNLVEFVRYSFDFIFQSSHLLNLVE